MRPASVLLLLLSFLLLHEGHAIWAMMESAGVAPELAYTASADLSAKDGTYALVADLTNALALLLVCLVLHSEARGVARIGAMFLSIYMATQAVWLVADPFRCDTLTSELATMAVAMWFTFIIGKVQALPATMPKIRTHP